LIRLPTNGGQALRVGGRRFFLESEVKKEKMSLAITSVATITKPVFNNLFSESNSIVFQFGGGSNLIDTMMEFQRRREEEEEEEKTALEICSHDGEEIVAFAFDLLRMQNKLQILICTHEPLDSFREAFLWALLILKLVHTA
jgi:hypothetical protein